MQNNLERDWSIAYHSANNIAAELLKQLKRDTPFDSVTDLVATHRQIREMLLESYREFNGSLVNGVPPVKGAVTAPVTAPVAQPAPAPVAAPVATPVQTQPAVTPATPESVKTAINMAIDSANTVDELNSIKERVLKATKISLEDQSAFLSKVEEKKSKLA